MASYQVRSDSPLRSLESSVKKDSAKLREKLANRRSVSNQSDHGLTRNSSLGSYSSSAHQGQRDYSAPRSRLSEQHMGTDYRSISNKRERKEAAEMKLRVLFTRSTSPMTLPMTLSQDKPKDDGSIPMTLSQDSSKDDSSTSVLSSIDKENVSVDNTNNQESTPGKEFYHRILRNHIANEEKSPLAEKFERKSLSNILNDVFISDESAKMKNDSFSSDDWTSTTSVSIFHTFGLI